MANRVSVEFTNGFEGISTNGGGSRLAISGDAWRPYELLFSALASCMYATFLDVIEKKRLAFESVTIEVDGEKLEDVPAYLKKCDIVFTIHGAAGDDEAVAGQFSASLKLAEKYCSIYNTLAKIAEMNTRLVFG